MNRQLGTIFGIALFGGFTAFGGTWTWKTVANGNWIDSANWTKPDGEAASYPNDASADVVFPGAESAEYCVTLPTSQKIVVHSLRVMSPSANSSKWTTLNGGSLEIGEGGVSFDNTAYSCGFSFRSMALSLPVSQNWLISSYGNGVSLYFNGGSVTVPEGVTWTIAGKSRIMDNSCSFKNMKGTLRTNANFGFYGGNPLTEVSSPGKIEFFDAESPIAGAASMTYTTYELKSSNLTVMVSSPIEFDLASKSFEFGLSRSSYTPDNAWRHRITAGFTGEVPAGKLVFSQGTSTLATHFPFKQYCTIEGDNSGLTVADDGAICISQGVFVPKHENALGTGNTFDVYFGNSSSGGYLTGLLTTDGINIAGDLELTPKNSHVVLGLFENGSATFSGDISASGLSANAKTQLHLVAPTGATVNVTGAIDLSGAYNRPVVISGGGTVVLSGDNSAMSQQGLSVRDGRAVLAHANAAGTQAISLGGTVPGVTTVRGLLDTSFDYLNGTWRYYGEIKATGGVYTIPKNYPLKFDGLAMTTGDRFAQSPCGTSYGVIYEMTSSSTFVAVSDVTYAEGLRIKVTDGNTFGGRAVYLANGSSSGGSMMEDGVDPDVALLAKNGVTVANDIEVTDNRSAGLSILGCGDGSSVTFTGDVTLNRSVTFACSGNGTATFTGSMTDAGGVKHAIGVSGAGTAVIPDIDWNGRTLDLSALDPEALDASGKTIVPLLRANGVGNATVIQPAHKGKWAVSVYRNVVIASKDGMMLLVR